MTYVPLHLHTEYSLLDGLSRVPELVRRAQELSLPALGLADHGNTYGAYEFYHECTGAGIKPIIGMEAYLAPAERTRREPVPWGEPAQKRDDVSRGGAYLHCTLFAEDATGLRNLYRIQREASATGFYFKPRVDLELLAEFSAGLLCTSGCPGGPVWTRLRLGQLAAARDEAARLRDIFGDRFYIELMDHGLPIERDHLSELAEIAADLGVPTVLGMDSHYVREEDASVHDALLCLQTGSRLSDDDRFRFNGTGYHLLGDSEARALAVPAAAVDRTLEVMERVGDYSEVFEKKLRMPGSPSDLRQEITNRYHIPTGCEEEDRLEEELDVIESMHYEGYFLTLAEVCDEARSRGILVGPGRGSACGSLVAYALGITDIDPMEHGLYFERFLNPERISLPDIDLDFPEDRRDEILDWTLKRYGADYVAQILTFGRIGAKQALKDAARVSGLSYSEGEALVKQLPPARAGKQPTLADLPAPCTGPVVDLARSLEGLVRQVGQHASGVVISPDPLVDILPIEHPVKDGVVGRPVTGFDAGPAEALGLVKMDYLGLRNLTVLQRASEAAGVWPTHLPLDDRKTYELLARGDTTGVFQLDSDGMKELLRGVNPTQYSDVAAVLALYRPGPMGAKAHLEYASRARSGNDVPAIHPALNEDLKPLLAETHGLIVYQEQVMSVVRHVAGYTLGQADILRKAMGHKDLTVLEAERPRFAAGMAERGYPPAAVDALWDVLIPFSDYAFNKSHATGYARVAYWTAYLKANHPAEFMAALLTSVSDDPARRPTYLQETTRLGIPLQPPSVNAADLGFTAHEGVIHYGLPAIIGVGEKVSLRIRERAPYVSLDDFLKRSHASVLNVRVLRALVRAGALDGLANREALDRHLEDLLEQVATQRELGKQGYGLRLAGRQELRVPAYRVDGLQRQRWELETMGVALTTVPTVLRYTRPVTLRDVQWLKSFLEKHPGSSPAYVAWNDWKLDLGMSVNLPWDAAGGLDAMGIVVE